MGPLGALVSSWFIGVALQHAITITALAGQADLGVRQRDVDVARRAGLAVVVAVPVGPHHVFPLLCPDDNVPFCHR